MSAGYILVEADTSAKLEQPIPGKWNSGLSTNLVSRFITAIGNFSIQYNFQAISVCLMIMSVEQCTSTEEMCKQGKQAHWVMGTAAATVFAGAILGQLTMGYVGDVLDRNTAMTLTLSIASLAAVASAVLPMGSPTSVYIVIIICRFVLGAGLGGVYPISAAKAAEDGSAEEQQQVPKCGSKDGDESKEESADLTIGRMTDSKLIDTANTLEDIRAGTWRSALSFVWQVPGSMTPWALAYMFSFYSFEADTQWRLLLGLGSIPAALVVLLQILEIELKKRKSAMTNVKSEITLLTNESRKSIQKEKQASIFRDAFRDRVIWFKVLYTGGGWFLYDVCFYGVGLFGGEIVASISPKTNEPISSPGVLRSTSLKQVFALSLGIPGLALSLLLLKPLGTKRLQTLGFLAMAFSFTLLASVYEQFMADHPTVLYGIYCLLLLALSFGPMLTIFILPAETFPKEIRATFGGIAAACGKLGAFVGAYLFGPLASATSFPFVMAVCAVLAVFGALLSHYCIGAENFDSDCSTNGRPSFQVPFTNASECTLSLMHSQCPQSNSPPASPHSQDESLALQMGGVHTNSLYKTITEEDTEATQAVSAEDAA